MFVFILIVLVLAALFGVLGVVLKATAIVLFTLLLVLAILVGVAWWAVKRSARRISAQYDQQVSEHRVTKYRENEADPGELPPDRDDRY